MTTILRIPLFDGDPVGHWRLGQVREARFDVADRAMAGDMDPFFFLAREKNFIPHEYPCRTEFAARFRGRRPEPKTGFEPAEFWFPFGGRRVDLSGFWFRPTAIERRARTAIEAAEAQRARFRFATCGGAILSVNGAEVAWLAGYRRNFEEAAEIDVSLRAGSNDIEVWFGDLCERDTRYYFELSLVRGTALSVALPVGVDAARAHEIGALLDGVRFERPWFEEGEVALLFPFAASTDHPIVVGDDKLADGPRTFTLRRGESRLPIFKAAELPADYHHFAITVGDGPFLLSRRLAVEVVHAAGEEATPHTIDERTADALAHVVDRGQPGAVCALARLALGFGGEETDAMIAGSLPAIVDCHDCADFDLVPLLWARAAYGHEIGRAVRRDLDAAILGFRYWLDEPGNDVMWFFSENHALLFHAACHLGGELFPDATFRRSGRSGREQSRVGLARLRGWFDHFERDEMAEWNSAPYFPIDFKGLAALAALARDSNIHERAMRAIRRLIEIVARSSHHGMLTASQGRSYEHSLIPCRTLELSAIARLFFGRGSLGATFHALPLLALLVRDHDFRIDAELSEVADFRGEGALEWRFRQGPSGIAALYHYKTADYAMGSVAGFRPGKWGYQETVLHLRLGEKPEAQIWINHPGEPIVAGYARPSYWGGCGTLPRVHQYRALAVVDFALSPGQVDFTHAWLPEAAMDEVRHDGDRIVARAGGAMALLIGSGNFEAMRTGPTAGCEIRLAGMRSRWIVRLGAISGDRTLAAAARFGALRALDGPDGEIWLDDPEYGRVVCYEDGRIEAEGRLIDPSSWTHAGAAIRLPPGDHVTLPSRGRQDTQTTGGRAR